MSPGVRQRRMRVGNAPVSWGIYRGDERTPSPAALLDAIAAAGYDGTELGPYGYLPTEADALRAELGRRRLGLASSFVALPLEDAGRRDSSVATALRVARLLAEMGVHDLILADDEEPGRAAIAGRVPPDGTGFAAAAWDRAAETINAVTRALRHELGMGAVFHHHAGTCVETPAEIARLLALTDVGLLLDTGHAVYGGGEPLELLARHGDRIRYVHLKDVRRAMLERVRTSHIPMALAVREGLFCPLGEGVVDFPALLRGLRERGYSGWLIVEQDVVPDPQGRLRPDPFSCARASRLYLRERCGV